MDGAHVFTQQFSGEKRTRYKQDYFFNAPLVHNFIRTIGIYPVGTLVRLASGYLAVVIEQHHDDLLRPKVRLIFNSKTLSYIQPWDYDLSKFDSSDRIIAFEVPSRWGIDPVHYI